MFTENFKKLLEENDAGKYAYSSGYAESAMESVIEYLEKGWTDMAIERLSGALEVCKAVSNNV